MTAFLASLDPEVFYTAVAMLTGGLIYLWRKLSYASWDAVTRKNPLLQDLPAVILSGLMSVAPALDKAFWPALGHILFGAVFGGGTAIVAHHALKDSPLPYTGGTPPEPPMFPKPDSVTATTVPDRPQS
jgi:hypothetical protein